MSKKLLGAGAAIVFATSLIVTSTVSFAEGNSKENQSDSKIASSINTNATENQNDPKFWGSPSQNIQSDADQQNYDRNAPQIPGITVNGVRVFGQYAPKPQNNALTKATFAGTGNLTDHRGSLLSTVKLYPIFWGSTFAGSGGRTYKGDVTTFLNNIQCGTSPACGGLSSLVSQYMRGASVSIQVGTTYTDTSNPPTSAPSTATIVAEAQKVVAAAKGTLDKTGLYLVFTNNFPSRANYCGWHGAGSAKVGTSSTTIAVAYLPNPATMAGCNATYLGSSYFVNSPIAGADSVINITSHEIYEAMTDSIQSGNAWYDASGYEIGDKCAWNYGATNLGGYAVQTEYSNTKGTCSNS